jgi:hypothetical protein
MNKSKIIKAQLLLFFVTISMCTKAQDSSFVSAVTYKRGILDTKIFHFGARIFTLTRTRKNQFNFTKNLNTSFQLALRSSWGVFI